MFFIISVNGTMYISVSHSVAYVLYWNFYDFKNFFIYCMFKPLSCSTKVCWNHPFSYCFLSVTVEIQLQRIFLTCVVNYFCSKEYLFTSSFFLLSTIYLYKLKSTSCSLRHSQKIHNCKNMYIFGAFTLIKSQGILF